MVDLMYYEVSGFNSGLERVGYRYIRAGNTLEAANTFFKMYSDLHQIDVQVMSSDASPRVRYNVIHLGQGDRVLERVTFDVR